MRSPSPSSEASSTRYPFDFKRHHCIYDASDQSQLTESALWPTKVIGNDIYDVGGHISVTPDPKAPNEEALMADPTLVSSNLIANNHMTQVFLRGGWQLRGTPPTGARLSHNLIHDAAGQVRKQQLFFVVVFQCLSRACFCKCHQKDPIHDAAR